MSAVVSLRNASKTFGARQVLRNVDLEIGAGEVHGLLGQNGSGKSTLIKILSGYHSPDPGAELEVRGEPVRLPLAPGASRRLGIAFVHQDLGLVDSATVVENVRLGRYETGAGWRVDWRREAARVRRDLDSFGIETSPDVLVSRLKAVDRALLAIIRALGELEAHGEGGVLVLDEPTAYLPYDGAERLFAAVRAVTSRGFGVLFVSHRLDEVAAITDRVSVLRDGELVACVRTAQSTKDDLVHHILGFDVETMYPTANERMGGPALTVRGLSGAICADFGASFRAGEITVLTGLIGSGFEEIPYLIFGAERPRGGVLAVDGVEVDARSIVPAAAMRHSIAFLPGDRQRLGGVPSATVLENASITVLDRYFKGGRIRLRSERRGVESLLAAFQVTPREPATPLSLLSGGNQQKVLLAKWFATGARVILLHEPTHGVDVGAKREILQMLRNAAANGACIVIATSDQEDLQWLADRVIVFRRGAAVAELTGAALTDKKIIEACYAA